MNTISPAFISALRDASVFAPELPEGAAFETLETLEVYEHTTIRGRTGPTLVADYVCGTAKYPDQVKTFGDSSGAVLVSADHATSPFHKSKGIYRGADHGTAGLAILLSNKSAQAVVPIGRQTGNVATSPDSHPVKQQIGELLPSKSGFISLHGMASGKLRKICDPTEIHAIVGLGVEPNNQSWCVAENIIAVAKDLGLRAIIGNQNTHLRYDVAKDDFEYNEDGMPITGELKAHRPDMTTNYAYRVMAETGRQIPSLQLEMTRLLRLIPADFYDGWHKDKKARAMGVHLGYLLASAAVYAIQNTESQQQN